MHLDVEDLRRFYYHSTLGRAAQGSLRAGIRDLWPDTQGQSVAGYGFAVPFLRPFMKTSRRVIALMPAPQGVMAWPKSQANISVLCEETTWPLETGHIDRLLVVHGLETSERPGPLLEECWRVLGPGGRVLFAVPNRAGLWSRSDRTPFGYGRPYTFGQLESQLRQHSFTPERHRAALFQLPSNRRFWQKAAPIFERAGNRMPQFMPGGVLLVEASKRVTTPDGSAIKDRARSALPGLAPEPETSPV